MDSFTVVSGKAAPMLAANIDTDVIMPKQFLKGVDRLGLAKGVFFDQRFLESGESNPEFILNQAAWRGAKFLVVGPNFGCGSSREHAVWGLKQLGIRALIGTSYAGIFFDNCQRNGLLAVVLPPDQLSKLASQISSSRTVKITIDLPGQTIATKESDFEFDIEPLRKSILVQGLDAIGGTLQRAELIREFECKHLQENPWLS
jgi:3-isopropylmalate/(R)-2-methylmalate dehydratase small subunit